jgi:hypothetical membrane protein
MHQRADLAAGNETLTDTIHITLAAVTVLLMIIAMLYGAHSFGRQFRIYSYSTILALLIFGLLTSIEAPKVNKNLSTPLMGVWERINIALFLLWVIVLAAVLMHGRENKIAGRAGKTT